MSLDEYVVFIIDDDPSMRRSLESLIRSVGLKPQSFETTQDFLLAERPEAPCCLVLDVRLPGRSGLEFQRELVKSGIRLPVIFITGHGDIPMSVAAMKAGAVEFLTKPFEDERLLGAIAGAIERSRAILGREAELQVLRDRHATLSHREREVMDLVVAGLLNKQIAGKLHISEITVKAHRGKVMRKMQAGSLAELVRIAGRLGPATTAPIPGSDRPRESGSAGED